MRMQEPEQWQPFEQEWQEDQSYGAYRTEDSGRYEPQQQKIYPEAEQNLKRTALIRVIVILSWFAIFLTFPGIFASASSLRYTNGQPGLLAAGVVGLVSSILVLTMFLAIFILGAVALAKRSVKKRS